MAKTRSFRAEDAPHAVFPLGGIGSGSVGIGADGRFQDWEIFNRPSKGGVNGFTPSWSAFWDAETVKLPLSYTC